MIKANELMLNNWVLLHGEYFQIKELSDGEVTNPIPLTEEILLKCGFEKDNCNWTLLFESYGGLVIRESRATWTNKFIGYFLVLNDHEIKYIHQLQNLYFALTGEELKSSYEQINE